MNARIQPAQHKGSPGGLDIIWANNRLPTVVYGAAAVRAFFAEIHFAVRPRFCRGNIAAVVARGPGPADLPSP
jgi:hypothetical protein